MNPTFLCGSRYLNFWGPTKYSIVAPFGLIHEIPAIPSFTLWYNDGRRAGLLFPKLVSAVHTYMNLSRQEVAGYKLQLYSAILAMGHQGMEL